MAYQKQNWKNGSQGGTPITAHSLNHIEDGIEAASNDIEMIKTEIGDVGSILDSINGTEV